MINKCKDELASAIAQSCVAAFNYQQKDDDVKVQRTFGDITVTFEAKQKGYGLAFWLSEKEFIVMTNENESEFAFGTHRVEKVEYGSFKDGKWVAEECDATIRGNRVVIDGYKVTKVTIN